MLRSGGHAYITSASLDRARAILRQATPEVIVTTAEADQLRALLAAAPAEVPFMILGRTDPSEVTGASHRAVQVLAPPANSQILPAVESVVAGGGKTRHG